jgi:hypothetical protein
VEESVTPPGRDSGIFMPGNTIGGNQGGGLSMGGIFAMSDFLFAAGIEESPLAASIEQFNARLPGRTSAGP